ncbi:MAG: phosphoribosylamine--glycine ligase, partial [Clostridia bacterium]|nr:phosphoribosylamine--glycine ligase [Clostridia bacterium]
TDTEAVYVAGAKIKDGVLVTGGGRVLGAVAVRDTLKEAIDAAYVVADGVQFANKYMRHDIGQRALAAKN